MNIIQFYANTSIIRIDMKPALEQLHTTKETVIGMYKYTLARQTASPREIVQVK